jgi:hypothetical protein
MTPDLITIEASRLCASANGWRARFDRYEALLRNIGMTEAEAEREVTAAYREEIYRRAA